MNNIERRALQIVVSIATLVPIGAGAAGVFGGTSMLMGGAAVPAAFDSHFRYLSGLLLAIGVGFVTTVPRIEIKERRFRLLAVIVVTGGLARLLSVLVAGQVSRSVIFALLMELVVTPALALWQHRIAKKLSAR